VITFNWRRKSDGEPMAKVGVTWTLTREGLADVLCAVQPPETADTELTKSETERLIREQLKENADARHWWRDRDDPECGVSNDEIFDWALRQVNQL
jgi:hypothetical protein